MVYAISLEDDVCVTVFLFLGSGCWIWVEFIIVFIVFSEAYALCIMCHVSSLTSPANEQRRFLFVLLFSLEFKRAYLLMSFKSEST
jgi:hypothetical protein